MATTRSRPRGRETARPNTGGSVAEHLNKIYGVAIFGVILIVAFLTLTTMGHVVDLAVQHFMLFYAGVFALIALCASVGAGLIATDRMFLNPGHRVMVQSAHRAISFGALVFLIIHIVTEILAQRVHVIDAFIPFLSPFKTFYIGLGTISSDLIILLVITGVFRKKFTGNQKNVWRWRAIHYASYVAFVFGVWHGLLGGRPGKPYVDWSYGFVVAFVALGLAIRILANSLRPKESLSAPPVAESASSGSAPMRAASMFAQLGLVRSAAPAAMMAPGGAAGMLSGGAMGARTGGMPAVAALPSAPGYAQTAVVPGYAETTSQMPIYEPGYDGPPRYAGAPRNTGPMPQAAGPGSGPMPRPMTGPMPRIASGPMPQAAGMPSGPQRPATGPMPVAGGPVPWAAGPGSGPTPRPMTGPVPRMPSGPMPSGPMTRGATGAMPQAPGPRSGPMQRPPSGPNPMAGYGGPGGAPYGGQPQPYGAPVGGPEPGAPVNGPGQWDGDFPEPDPSMRYWTPGPGMPGYRVPDDHYRRGDDRR